MLNWLNQKKANQPILDTLSFTKIPRNSEHCSELPYRNILLVNRCLFVFVSFRSHGPLPVAPLHPARELMSKIFQFGCLSYFFDISLKLAYISLKNTEREKNTIRS